MSDRAYIVDMGDYRWHYYEEPEEHTYDSMWRTLTGSDTIQWRSSEVEDREKAQPQEQQR